MIISFLIGLLLGFVAGLLFFRNNSAKAKALEERGKVLLNSLKRGD